MSTATVTERCADLVRERLSGRRVICAMGALPPSSAQAARLVDDLGAERCLVIADTRGAGEVVEHDAVEHLVLDIKVTNLMEGFRVYQRLLADPTPAMVSAIERFDPAGDAVGLLAPIYDLQSVMGRPVIGARAPGWVALEDKVVADELWDAAGVPRAASRIFPATGADMLEASLEIDDGAGVVWSGDARDGMNGGATYVRWIRDTRNGEEVDEAVSWLGPRCDRVRVMPFLDGIPCSIHGIVFPESVMAFRPVELAVFRRPEGAKLLYAGVNTFWDPAPADREEMRGIARRTGAMLRKRVGYRGGFTVDGVITADGFRPTELNARLGIGIAPIASATPDLPLQLLETLVREGLTDADVEPEALEHVLVDAADARRNGGGWTVVDPELEIAEYKLAITDDSVHMSESHVNGTLTTGPSFVGGFVRYSAEADGTPVGPSLAPRIARVFDFADAHVKAGIGPITPAPSRR